MRSADPMMTMENVALGGLVALSVGMCAFWGIVGFHLLRYHVLRTRNYIPAVPDGLRLPEADLSASGAAPPSVCVIVPAHNEQEVIAHLVESLTTQDYPNLRVVFSLDRCTDGTRAEIDRVLADKPDARTKFEIIEITRCPEGWAGKVNAMCTAVRESAAARTADVLMFVDADTMLHPACTRATVALLRNRNLDMLSLLSTLTCDRWFERYVQPATAMELMYQYPIHRANRLAEGRRPFANGQFVMFRREAYERFGGHAAVQGETLEDVRIAQAAARTGLAAGVFLSSGMLHCRMYRDWAEFQRGWNRIFSESRNCRPKRLHAAARRVLITCSIGPFFALGALLQGLWPGTETSWLLAGAGLVTGAAALVAYWTVLAMVYRVAMVPLRYVVTFPIAGVFTAYILWKAAKDLEQRRPTVWAGMKYERVVR